MGTEQPSAPGTQRTQGGVDSFKEMEGRACGHDAPASEGQHGHPRAKGEQQEIPNKKSHVRLSENPGNPVSKNEIPLGNART